MLLTTAETQGLSGARTCRMARPLQVYRCASPFARTAFTTCPYTYMLHSAASPVILIPERAPLPDRCGAGGRAGGISQETPPRRHLTRLDLGIVSKECQGPAHSLCYTEASFERTSRPSPRGFHAKRLPQQPPSLETRTRSMLPFGSIRTDSPS